MKRIIPVLLISLLCLTGCNGGLSSEDTVETTTSAAEDTTVTTQSVTNAAATTSAVISTGKPKNSTTVTTTVKAYTSELPLMGNVTVTGSSTTSTQPTEQTVTEPVITQEAEKPVTTTTVTQFKNDEPIELPMIPIVYALI